MTNNFVKRLLDSVLKFLGGSDIYDMPEHPDCPECSGTSGLYEGTDCWCIPLHEIDRLNKQLKLCQAERDHHQKWSNNYEQEIYRLRDQIKIYREQRQ